MSIDLPDTSPDTTPAPLAQSRTYPHQADQATALLTHHKFMMYAFMITAKTFVSIIYIPDSCRGGGTA